MNILSKITRGSKFRKTRFHDEKGNVPSLKRIIVNGVKSYLTGALRLIFGWRPELPWISYDAIHMIEKCINKESKVLEYGSGMSTIWYAKKAGYVISVENYKPWYDKIKKIIDNKKIKNINYLYADTAANYTNPSDEKGFDLIMVDGAFRSECIINSIHKLSKSGIIYLDNSDKDTNVAEGDIRIAENFLKLYAEENGAEILYFTDFAPTQFTPNQGMMVINQRR